MLGYPSQHVRLGPIWAPNGQLYGSQMGCPYPAQGKVSLGVNWVPSGQPIWAAYVGPSKVPFSKNFYIYGFFS